MALSRRMANNPALLLSAAEAAAALLFGFALDLSGRQVGGAMAVVALVTGVATWATAYGPQTVGDIVSAETMLADLAEVERHR